MKKIFTFLMSAIVFLINISAQDIDIQIKEIKSKFANTEKNLKNYKSKIYENNNHKYTAYYDSVDECVLLRDTYGSESSLKEEISYYSKSGVLYFVFSESISEIYNFYKQNRIYLNDSLIIQFLTKDIKYSEKSKLLKTENVEVDIKETGFNEINNQYLTALKYFYTYSIFNNESDSLSAITSIRKEYAKIKSDIHRTENVRWEAPNFQWYLNNEFEVNYDINDRIIMFKVSWADEGVSGYSEYYFKNEKPFFVFSSEESWGYGTESEEQTIYQERVYLADNKILAILIKTKTPESNESIDDIKNEKKIMPNDELIEQYNFVFSEVNSYKKQIFSVLNL